MAEFVIILGIAICAGLLVFIALTLHAMGHDLFKIRQILKSFETKHTPYNQEKSKGYEK